MFPSPKYSVRCLSAEDKPLLTAHNPELLDAVARLVAHSHFGDVDVALRVHGHGVSMREFTRLVARATEIREDLPSGVIEYINLLVLFIQDLHEPLCRIGRKTYPSRRAPGARQISRPGRLGPFSVVKTQPASFFVRNRYVLLEVANLVEHLHPVAPPVAHVHPAVVVNGDAMRNLHELVAKACLHLGLGARQNPLAQEVPITIEHRHSMIATGLFAIGNVNVAVARVDHNTAGPEESGMTRIQSYAADSAI